MTEDDLIETDFFKTWAGIRLALETRCGELQNVISGLFDQARYAGLGSINGQQPFSIDLTGPSDRVPYTITLNKDRMISSIMDQFDYESKGLIDYMAAASAQYRLLTGGSRIEWVKSITPQLVLPPTTEELIKFSGKTHGFSPGDAIEDPVVWVGGRVVVGKVILQ